MMYIFSERGDQELSKTVSIMFIRHFSTILQYPEEIRVFSGIEYCGLKELGNATNNHSGVSTLGTRLRPQNHEIISDNMGNYERRQYRVPSRLCCILEY